MRYKLSRSISVMIDCTACNLLGGDWEPDLFWPTQVQVQQYLCQPPVSGYIWHDGISFFALVACSCQHFLHFAHALPLTVTLRKCSKLECCGLTPLNISLVEGFTDVYYGLDTNHGNSSLHWPFISPYN